MLIPLRRAIEVFNSPPPAQGVVRVIVGQTHTKSTALRQIHNLNLKNNKISLLLTNFHSLITNTNHYNFTPTNELSLPTDNLAILKSFVKDNDSIISKLADQYADLGLKKSIFGNDGMKGLTALFKVLMDKDLNRPRVELLIDDINAFYAVSRYYHLDGTPIKASEFELVKFFTEILSKGIPNGGMTTSMTSKPLPKTVLPPPLNFYKQSYFHSSASPIPPPSNGLIKFEKVEIGGFDYEELAEYAQELSTAGKIRFEGKSREDIAMECRNLMVVSGGDPVILEKCL